MKALVRMGNTSAFMAGMPMPARRNSAPRTSKGNADETVSRKRQSHLEATKKRITITLESKRLYYASDDDFLLDLKEFNSRNSQCDGDKKHVTELESGKYFMSVGRANVRLRFCTSCCDRNKAGKELDQYFVNTEHISQTRTTLCKGCLGRMLRQEKQKWSEQNDT